MTAPTNRPWRITVLISGSGTNLGALLSALPTSLSHCEITHVLSSRSTAFGLTRAASHTPPIPSSHFSLLTYRKTTGLDRASYDLELAFQIRATRPDLVVLAGWMLILSSGFLEALARDWNEEDLGTEGSSPYQKGAPGKGTAIPIINLHPALPGTFPGAHAIQDAWEAGKEGKITRTGIMVHRVIPLLDAGEPVVVREVELREGEALEGLEERIHEVEHEAIVAAVGKVVGMLGDGSWWE